MPGDFISSDLAKEMILNGTAPEELCTDTLVFDGEEGEIRLPKKLTVHRLGVKRCEQFRSLPEGLDAHELLVLQCPRFETVPATAWATTIFFEECPALRHFSARGSTIEVRGCPNLSLTGPFHCENLILPGS